MIFVNPPHTNGVMELTENEVLQIQEKLVVIQSEFIPSYDQPICDTFYLVVEYTKRHENDENFIRINGDTCNYALAYQVEGTQGGGE